MKRVLAVIMIISLFLCGCKSEKTISYESTNERAFYEISDNNFLYYISENNIVKYDPTQQEENILVYNKTNGTVNNLLLYNGDIYYFVVLDNSSTDFEIYKYSVSENKTTLLLTEEPFENDGSSLHNMEILRDNLYIKKGYGFYCYNLKDGSFKKLINDVGTYHFKGNDLYFTDKAESTFTVYKIDLITEKRQIVLGDGSLKQSGDEKTLYKNFCFVNNDMYFFSRFPDGLFKYTETGSEKIETDGDIQEYSLFSSDDDLFFIVKENDGFSLQRYSTDISEITVITSVNNFSRAKGIKNGYYYYQDENFSWFRINICG